MTLEQFAGERRDRWHELERLVAASGRRAERLGPDGVRRLGVLYRAAAADLALARRRFPGEAVVRELDALVGRARPLVYDQERRGRSVAHFVTTGYWRRVRERPALLLAAALLLLLPWVLTAIWATRDPGAAAGVVPSQYRSVTQPRNGTDLGLSTDQSAAFSSEIFTNNIRVTFFSFAAGIAVGLGTALLLVYQGVIFGGVTGLAIWSGNGRAFFELTLAHGILELSCVVVGSAAGLRLGWALVAPGRRRRGVALAAEAGPAVEMVVGTIPWLVLAGLIEGFVTPAGLGLGVVLAIGLGLGSLYWGLVLWRGGAAAEPVPAIAPALTAVPVPSP